MHRYSYIEYFFYHVLIFSSGIQEVGKEITCVNTKSIASVHIVLSSQMLDVDLVP